jgi:acyl-Coa thioesterase superfamily protein/acyl-CoA thioesterase superfamily protein
MRESQLPFPTDAGYDLPVRRKFSEVTALEEREPGRFDANADPDWTIGGKPNGGYLLAMIGGAATRVSDHPDILAASAHYLRSPDPGPVTVTAEVLRAGRSASQVRASLAAGGKTCVEALVTLGRLDQEDNPYWQEGLPEVAVPSFEDCVPMNTGFPNGLRPRIMHQVDIRLDPETAGFMTGEPVGRGELRGWLSLPEGEPFDSPALLYAVDAFPPATLDIQTSGWVPTFELTAYVRAIPAPGPVRIVHRAQLIGGQLVDETCYVWDSKDRLVAQSTQLAGIRLG